MSLSESLRRAEASRGTNHGHYENAATSRLEDLLHKTGGLPVCLDGREKVFPVTASEVKEIILPLCSWLRGLLDELEVNGGSGGRVLVGLVGSAGAGKSVLSNMLCSACNSLWAFDGATSGWAKPLSMDGYSWPNSYLRDHSTRDTKGREHNLKEVKGIPCTLDVEGLLRDLLYLRNDCGDIALPAYDRDLHDPVPGRVTVTGAHRLVLVEGLHLLHQKGKWAEVSAAFHRTVFLDISRDLCFERVVSRKVSNGRSRDSSVEHFHRVDGPIYDRLQGEKHLSDVMIQLCPTEAHPLSVTKVTVRLCSEKLERVPWEVAPCHLPRLVVVGLNGAVQKQLHFPSTVGFSIGAVNRASSSTTGIGGKGQNVCVALSNLQEREGSTHLIHFCGGRAGALLEGLLREREVDIISGVTASELRTCTTLIDESSGEITEIVEPWGGDINLHEADALLALTRSTFSGTAGCVLDGVVIAGSLPKGVQAEFPSQILSALVGSGSLAVGVPVLVDSVHGLPQLLVTGHVGMLKVNAKELIEVAFGISVATKAAVGDLVCGDSLTKDAAISVSRQYQALKWIAVTNGPGHSLLFSCENLVAVGDEKEGRERKNLTYWRYELPTLSKVVSPIGAGDATTATTLFCWAAGAPTVDAFHAGLAVGSASCMMSENSCFEFSTVLTIFREIRVFLVSEVYPPMG